MEHLEKLILLKQKAAYQETPPGTGEPAFKAHARKKQSLFRQMVFSSAWLNIYELSYNIDK